MLLAPFQATLATDDFAKRDSTERLSKASPPEPSLASVPGADLAKAVGHDTDNKQIIYKGMWMNIPVGMDEADVATALRRYENDAVGDTLQRVTKDVAGGWRLEGMLSAEREHYESLVANPIKAFVTTSCPVRTAILSRMQRGRACRTWFFV